MMYQNAYCIGAHPLEYRQNPKLVKAKIRHNKEIIKLRELEAKGNEGNISAAPILVE